MYVQSENGHAKYSHCEKIALITNNNNNKKNQQILLILPHKKACDISDQSLLVDLTNCTFL